MLAASNAGRSALLVIQTRDFQKGYMAYRAIFLPGPHRSTDLVASLPLRHDPLYPTTEPEIKALIRLDDEPVHRFAVDELQMHDHRQLVLLRQL